MRKQRARCHVVVLETTKMALNVQDVINAIYDENFETDDAGISSDEEEDLDRLLESSGDARKASIYMFLVNRCCHVMAKAFKFAFDALVTFYSN